MRQNWTLQHFDSGHVGIVAPSQEGSLEFSARVFLTFPQIFRDATRVPAAGTGPRHSKCHEPCTGHLPTLFLDVQGADRTSDYCHCQDTAKAHALRSERGVESLQDGSILSMLIEEHTHRMALREVSWLRHHSPSSLVEPPSLDLHDTTPQLNWSIRTGEETQRPK